MSASNIWLQWKIIDPFILLISVVHYKLPSAWLNVVVNLEPIKKYFINLLFIHCLLAYGDSSPKNLNSVIYSNSCHSKPVWLYFFYRKRYFKISVCVYNENQCSQKQHPTDKKHRDIFQNILEKFGVEKIFTSKLEEHFTNNYKEMQVTLN